MGEYFLWKSLRDYSIPGWKIYTKKVSTSRVLPYLSRLINKYLYFLGVGSVVNRYDNSFTLFSSKYDKPLYDKYGSEAIFCNFGSGAFFHKKWRNFDFPASSKYYKAIQGKAHKDFEPIDLCQDPLVVPLASESVHLIYCSHTLEHLDFDSAIRFISECFRILKPNGVMRIVVPSTYLDFFILKFFHEQVSISDDDKKKLAAEVAKHLLADTTTITDAEILKIIKKNNFNPRESISEFIQLGINQRFDPQNPGRHISFWDYGQLTYYANILGFKLAIPVYRGVTSEAPFTNLHIFDSTEHHISLYFEITK